MNNSLSRILGYGCATLFVVSIAVSNAGAVAIVAVKSDDLLQNQTTSAFYTSRLDGVGVLPAGGWAPAVPTQAAAATTTSTSPKKSYNIVGNSTSAGGWLDGNRIPTGITLTFDAQFTITALPNAGGGLLTHPGGPGIGQTSQNDFGRGLGITGVVAGPNDFNAGQGISVSAVTVSGVNFSGTLAEAGFTFTPGTVANFGTILFRSTDFDEATDGMILTQGANTIGFGTDVGNVASNLAMNNNFGGGTPPSSFFPRQTGPYTFVASTEGPTIKGMTLEYDVTYDVSPVSADDADFDGDDDVDGEDFLIWQRGVGTAGGQPQGNADGVGNIDGDDLAIWEAQFGSAVAAANPVPEPAGAALLAVGGVALWAIRRRRAQG